LIKSTKGRRVIIAFDPNYLIDEAVCLRLASLLVRRLQSEMTLKLRVSSPGNRLLKGSMMLCSGAGQSPRSASDVGLTVLAKTSSEK
jgi:hypothetical protein